MKTATIILGIIFLMIPFLSAKESVPNVRWSEIIPGETPDLSIIYRYEIGQDTVINQQVYSKLMRDNLLFGAIRENQDQKVFIYFPTTEQEQLLYDFNWENEPATDSIRLFNNKPYAIKNEEYGKVIQGIGSLSGFFAPLNEYRDQSTSLLCYWKNDQLLYLNPDYTNCEGGKSYKSCFGKEYTKYTVIVDSRVDYVGSSSIIINNKLEVDDSLDAYFTEDISSGELTFKQKEGTEESEWKIMNLNVWIGDTIILGDYSQSRCFRSIHEYYYGNRYYVDLDGDWVFYALVDSIYFEDNRKHIRMDVVVPNYHCTNGKCADPYLFIEGHGPNTGLSSYLSGYYACTYLLCYETESEFYLNPYFEKCTYYLETPSLIIGTPFQAIQMNNELKVSFIEPFSGQLYLYDSLGRLFCQQFVDEQLETTLPITSLPRGIYYLRCNDIAGKILNATKLIIR